MSVLDSIIEGVREDLAARRLSSGEILERMYSVSPAIPLLETLRANEMSVIAEVKRSSPSKGELSKIADPAALAAQYEEAGASVISVLTEKRRFGGSLDDLDSVRSRVRIPILRKDFMIDEYQFFEARAHGADVVLLIVAAISASQLRDYYAMTLELGMSAIIEVHTEDELERALEISPEIIGINARNLKTLDVDLAAFSSLMPRIPDSIIKVAESGISMRADVELARDAGASVILVGEALVRSSDPALTLRQLLGQG
ncbi:unannotated protein [freshwater metagenome]|uniref:indole-3-glycerol-phosphate synthase n=1 Tax=freshwater metagenome TaxID=449393 RepID=A0A6J7XRN2_9ZZZZ|nr:indole-3-glycerol phosphate synthase TrpC [Actinomycetota bacterium]